MTAGRALDQEFTAYGEKLERVEVFKYLGRLLSFDDNDIQAVRSNLKKARKVWSRISRVLRAENASPRVCRIFYKATVQVVLQDIGARLPDGARVVRAMPNTPALVQAG